MSLNSPSSSAARSVKFGRQSGAGEEDSYGYGAGGYAAYWKNMAASNADKEEDYGAGDDDEDEDEDDEDDEEEEEDDDDDDEEEAVDQQEGKEEGVVGPLAALKLDETKT